MTPPPPLSFALTCAGTLAVAVMVFRGQVIAFTALLVLAGILKSNCQSSPGRPSGSDTAAARTAR